MSRYLGITSAAVLILAVIGCSLDSFLIAPTGLTGQKQVVAGSVAQVSAKLEEGFSEAGISVLTKQVGTEIRLAGQTKSGKIFCVHLYGEKVEGKDKTLVRVKWDRDADDEFWRMVLKLVATPAPDSKDNLGPADAR
jgi:hypothetical protein